MSFMTRFFGKKNPTAADLAAVVERLESDAAANEAEIRPCTGSRRCRVNEGS